MEAAVLYTLGAIHTIETLCMVTISDIIATAVGTSERISDADLKLGVDRMMTVACDVAIADLN
jgi:purine-nucleoside phosphorylase